MRRAFTLIEVLVVVVILGILAAIIVPQFEGARHETNETSVTRTLQIVRHQIEYFRARELVEPDLIGGQWGDLLQTDYLHSVPINPMNLGTRVAAAPAAGVGWIWRDDGSGVFEIYATDSSWVSEYVE